MPRILRLASLVFLLTLWPVLGQAATRVYVGSIEYTGPVKVEGDRVWVDLAALGQATGWVVERSGEAVSFHAARTTVSVPPEAGVYVAGRRFTGATRTAGDKLQISLNDLSRFLGGTCQLDPAVGVVQATIPNMPAAAAMDPRVTLFNQLHSTPFTLVYFYVTTDPYCKHLGPEVKKFAGYHQGELRLVEFDMLHQGSAWIYARYKTPNNGIPELVLVNSNGQVLQKLLGDTTADVLEKELGPLIR